MGEPKIEIDRAFELHRSGRLDEAIKLYKNIISFDPKNFDAHHYLGVANLQKGEYKAALDSLECALELNRSNTDLLTNVATAALYTENYDKLMQFSRDLLKIDPNSSAAFNNLGNGYLARGQKEEAIASFNKAITLDEKNSIYKYNRARFYFKFDNLDRAIVDFKDALRLGFVVPELFQNLALCFKSKGDTATALKTIGEGLLHNDNSEALLVMKADLLLDLDRGEEALDVIRQLTEKTRSTKGLITKAKILQKLGRPNDALEADIEAIRTSPDSPEAWNSMGTSYIELDCPDKALECFERAIALDETLAWAWSNKGNALENLGRQPEAIGCFQVALDLDPNLDTAHTSLGIGFLSAGNFAKGWYHYTWRAKAHKSMGAPRELTHSEWEGLGSEGSRIFVWAEQGVGDTILYSAMLKDLERLDRSFLVSTDERLRPIFERSFPAMRFVDRLKTIPEDQYDRHIPIGDLGKYFRDQLEKFGSTRPGYLVTDPLKDDKWKHVLHKTKSIKIGLSWKSTNKSFGRHKSIDLGALESLLSIPGIEFINLQYESSIEEINSLPPEIQKKIISLDGLDARNDLDNLLSVMQACDAIVTVSNTTAHLSGAIGKKTLVMLPYSQGKIWYWQNHPTLPGSLWYQSVQLSNQSQHGRWENVIDEIKIELEKIQKNKNI